MLSDSSQYSKKINYVSTFFTLLYDNVLKVKNVLILLSKAKVKYD